MKVSFTGAKEVKLLNGALKNPPIDFTYLQSLYTSGSLNGLTMDEFKSLEPAMEKARTIFIIPGEDKIITEILEALKKSIQK